MSDKINNLDCSLIHSFSFAPSIINRNYDVHSNFMNIKNNSENSYFDNIKILSSDKEEKKSKNNDFSNLKLDENNWIKNKINSNSLISDSKNEENFNVPIFKKNTNNVKVFKAKIKSKQVDDDLISFNKNYLAPLNISNNSLSEKLNNINNFYTFRGELNLEKKTNENKKYPQLCSKNLLIEINSTVNNKKTYAEKNIISEIINKEENFLNKKCIEICGNILIFPELLPVNCHKYLNREYDCVEKFKEKDSIYRDFITSNKALMDLEF